MKSQVRTTKKMTVKASDGFDSIALATYEIEGEEDPRIGFMHRVGQSFQGTMLLKMDDALQFADEIKRYVEFTRHEVEG